MRRSCELKRFSPSPATSTDEVVVFPPVQLRWRPLLWAFLPLWPRKSCTRPQGLTPPLFPRKPQLRHLGPTLSQNQHRAFPSLRVRGRLFVRRIYC